MGWIDIDPPPRSSRFKTPFNIVHSCVIMLLLACIITWPLMAGEIHRFATHHRDAAHPVAVEEHGGTFYLSPFLGRLYINMPWIWLGGLIGFVLMTVLRSKLEKKRMGLPFC